MIGQDIRDARVDLGMMWGLGRPLYATELGRLLRLGGKEPGRQVLRYENGKRRIPGPVAVCIEMMLRGGRPEVLQRMEKAS